MARLVDTIIVNFRTKELTADAVRSVLAEPESNQVIVVDNASLDDSAAFLQAEFKDCPVKVIESAANLGFGGGNNVGVRAATAEYIFLLNSDARVKPGAFNPLLSHLQNPSIGIVAPAVYLPDEKTLQRDAQGVFPTPLRILKRATTKEVTVLDPEWVSGVAMMLRGEEFLGLGGFDEEIFMYLEDVDLCYRYRQAGKQILRELSAQVVHLGGASKVSTKEQRKQHSKSTDYFLEKHKFPLAGRTAVKAARALRNLAS